MKYQTKGTYWKLRPIWLTQQESKVRLDWLKIHHQSWNSLKIKPIKGKPIAKLIIQTNKQALNLVLI